MVLMNLVCCCHCHSSSLSSFVIVVLLVINLSLLWSLLSSCCHPHSLSIIVIIPICCCHHPHLLLSSLFVVVVLICCCCHCHHHLSLSLLIILFLILHHHPCWGEYTYSDMSITSPYKLTEVATMAKPVLVSFALVHFYEGIGRKMSSTSSATLEAHFSVTMWRRAISTIDIWPGECGLFETPRIS